MPSDDGIVRTVQLRLPGKDRPRTLRAVVKLAPLGLNMELPGIQPGQLNAQRNAIFVGPPDGASQEEPQEQEEEEVIELGVNDL